MNQETQHRNKCQNCFKNVGKFILDCYCFLCMDCFTRQKAKNQNKCGVCFKPTSGKFIDTRDRDGMMKVNYLFGNFQATLSKCLDIYKFQNEIDLRYCHYLQNQLAKYKELLSSIIDENPRLADYVNKFFKRKSTPHRSVSENLQNHSLYGNQDRPANLSYSPQQPSKRMTTSSIQARHDKIVDPQRVNQGDRNFSAKIGYKVPNINYNTALRSSKRPNRRSEL